MNSTLHPTPQCARPHWTDLCGAWGFAHDDADMGLDQGWATQTEPFTRTIQVPFPPESRASQIHAPEYHPIVWYRRTFTEHRADDGRRLLLRFGAVDYQAMVWVNGQLVGQHTGGHTPFTLDITTALQSGDEQVVVVRAEDQPLDLGQPRGKQDWQIEPHAIWYYRTTGIWQPVWLEWVSAVYIESIQWTPHINPVSLGLHLTLNRKPTRPLAVRVQIALEGKTLVDDTYQLQDKALSRAIDLSWHDEGNQRDNYLWSPERPTLLAAIVTLLDDTTTLDHIDSYAGLRTATTQAGRFLLNGRPYYLRMVLEQGYWPASHLAAPSPDALRHEVELIKALGFNGVRIHQKVEDPRFLYWCDRLGLTVWGEMANSYVFTTEASERLVREWLEVIQRDYSHPCIITWVPINESWGVPRAIEDAKKQAFLKSLYALTKALDGTRPVIDNDGWEHVATDIMSIHDYAREGVTLQARYGTPAALANAVADGWVSNHKITLGTDASFSGAPIMLTEFGGISYAPKEGERWFGYGTVTTGDEYLAKLQELVSAVVACPSIVGFCYTQLTDTEQETNGLLTETREPKFDLATLRAIIQTPRA